MAGAAAAQPGYGSIPAVLTPAVKDAISEEVQRQLEAERSKRNTLERPCPPAVCLRVERRQRARLRGGPGNGRRESAVGGECSLSEGDVLQLGAGAPRDADSAGVVVLASKGRDCRRGTIASVQWPI